MGVTCGRLLPFDHEGRIALTFKYFALYFKMRAFASKYSQVPLGHRSLLTSAGRFIQRRLGYCHHSHGANVSDDRVKLVDVLVPVQGNLVVCAGGAARPLAMTHPEECYFPAQSALLPAAYHRPCNVCLPCFVCDDAVADRSFCCRFGVGPQHAGLHLSRTQRTALISRSLGRLSVARCRC